MDRPSHVKNSHANRRNIDLTTVKAGTHAAEGTEPAPSPAAATQAWNNGKIALFQAFLSVLIIIRARIPFGHHLPISKAHIILLSARKRRASILPPIRRKDEIDNE